jgi:hypothetical protein
MDEVFVISIRPQGSLSSPGEKPRQRAFSVVGKYNQGCGPGFTRPLVGSIISTLPLGRSGEARLGMFTFGFTIPPELHSCANFTDSCVSDGEGFPPPTWICDIEGSGGNAQFPFDLQDPKEQPLCQLFQIGEPELP